MAILIPESGGLTKHLLVVVTIMPLVGGSVEHLFFPP